MCDTDGVSEPVFQHVPPVEILLARLHAVEDQLRILEQTLEQTVSTQDRNGVLAHIAALTRRKTWYVRRIRKDRPIQAIGIGVQDTVSSGDRT